MSNFEPHKFKRFHVEIMSRTVKTIIKIPKFRYLLTPHFLNRSNNRHDAAIPSRIIKSCIPIILSLHPKKRNAATVSKTASTAKITPRLRQFFPLVFRYSQNSWIEKTVFNVTIATFAANNIVCIIFPLPS